MELTLIFYAIQIAKSFYDHGRFDVFKKAFPQHILREDSFYELQELALDIVSEFHCFNQKLDYEYDISSYYHYFSSENMTAYIRLCRQYESLLHMKPEENPFWREASTCIKNALWLYSYSYAPQLERYCRGCEEGRALPFCHRSRLRRVLRGRSDGREDSDVLP